MMDKKICSHFLEAILRLSKIEFFCDEVTNDPIDYILGMERLHRIYKSQCENKFDVKLSKDKISEALDYIGAEEYWKEWLDTKEF